MADIESTIRHRIRVVLSGRSMTPSEIHTRGVSEHRYPWHIDSVCMALRQMERDVEVMHDTPETYMMVPKKAPRKAKPKQKPRQEEAQASEMIFKHLEQTIEQPVKKTEDEPMNDIDQSLSDLEQRLTTRQIDNIEQKLKVLRRLAEILAPDIGEVLAEVAGDLEGMNG